MKLVVPVLVVQTAVYQTESVLSTPNRRSFLPSLLRQHSCFIEFHFMSIVLGQMMNCLFRKNPL